MRLDLITSLQTLFACAVGDFLARLTISPRIGETWPYFGSNPTGRPFALLAILARPLRKMVALVASLSSNHPVGVGVKSLELFDS